MMHTRVCLSSPCCILLPWLIVLLIVMVSLILRKTFSFEGTKEHFR